MSAKGVFVLMAGALGVAVTVAAADEAKHGMDLGMQEYQANCAQCHALSGGGEGPRAESLGRVIPDLTSFADRHGGLYPAQLAWITIDGRSLDEGVQRHREMPVWGQEYRNEALANPDYRAPESYAGERVGALVDYVATLQASWKGSAPRE
jgi:mono/diheme cytochrome c family protein